MSGKEMSGAARDPHAPCIMEEAGGEGGAETSLAVVEVLTVWLLGTEAFRLALILLGCG